MNYQVLSGDIYVTPFSSVRLTSNTVQWLNIIHPFWHNPDAIDKGRKTVKKQLDRVWALIEKESQAAYERGESLDFF